MQPLIEQPSQKFGSADGLQFGLTVGSKEQRLEGGESMEIQSGRVYITEHSTILLKVRMSTGKREDSCLLRFDFE